MTTCMNGGADVADYTDPFGISIRVLIHTVCLYAMFTELFNVLCNLPENAFLGSHMVKPTTQKPPRPDTRSTATATAGTAQALSTTWHRDTHTRLHCLMLDHWSTGCCFTRSRQTWLNSSPLASMSMSMSLALRLSHSWSPEPRASSPRERSHASKYRRLRRLLASDSRMLPLFGLKWTL